MTDNRERDELAVLVAEWLDMNDPEAGTLEPVRADFDLADAILAAGFRRTPEVADEWEYGTEGRFVATGEIDESMPHRSHEEAQQYADQKNEAEPRPNVFDGDDIEMRWLVVRRRRKTGPWLPVPSHPDTETSE